MNKCLECKKKYKKESNSQKFCSVLCRNNYWRESRNERYGAEYQAERRQEKLLKQGGDLIECLICGRRYQQVGTHIFFRHKITAREYREVYGFDVKRGQLIPELRALKAKQVFENGTWKNLKNGRKYWFVKGDKRAGRYVRSAQTMERLRKLHLYRFRNKK